MNKKDTRLCKSCSKIFKCIKKIIIEANFIAQFILKLLKEEKLFKMKEKVLHNSFILVKWIMQQVLNNDLYQKLIYKNKEHCNN